MFLPLLQFETGYQSRQKAFLIFSILFFGFGFLLGAQGFAPAQVHYNSGYQISYNTGLLSLGCVFAIMFFTITGILRDKQYRMDTILYSTSIKKPSYFLSRFLGIFLFSLLVFSMTLFGFYAGTLSPALDPERLTSFHFSHYVWTWAIIVVPNVFICSVLIFSVSILTKNHIATYLSAIVIYALYWLCAIFFNSPMLANSIPPSPENMIIAALADPFGLSAFFEQTQYWTPFQKNNQLISFSGYFLWNRLIWGFIAFLFLAITYRLFSFKETNKKVKSIVKNETGRGALKTYRPVSVSPETLKARKKSFISVLRVELIYVFKSLPFLAVILVWMVIVTTEIYSRINQGGVYNDSLYPTTNLLIWLIKDPLPVLSLILIIFYSGELVWRERGLKFHEILDATPVLNGVLFLSKSLVLLLLPAILIGISICIAVGFQIAYGYFNFEIGQYLSMFYYLGVGFVFYSTLALFIQNICFNKYLGMILTGLVILLFRSSFSSFIGIHDPLLRIGSLPPTTYTNMTGYGDYSRPFHYVAAHWNILGILLALCSFKLWQRGSIRRLSGTVKKLYAGWKPWQRISLVSLLILFLCTGSVIYYNTHIISEYSTPQKELDFREGYERKYKKYEHLKPLLLIDAKTKMDIYPDARKFILKANYLLENTYNTPIDTVLISERSTLQSLTLENAVPIIYDSIYETRLFVFKTPLLPGNRIQMSYKLIEEKTGFTTSNSLVNNGSYLAHTSFEPSLRYRSGMEIASDFERKKRGLPPRKEKVMGNDHFADNTSVYHRIGFEAIVSTKEGQTAIAPGALLKKWTENGRNYFHYKPSIKIMPLVAYFSAAYKNTRETFKNISIEQYYHPAHEYNIENIQYSAKKALQYCITNFGEYPFNHLRIAEIPGHWSFGGQALPGTISMVEDRLYLLDNTDPDGFNLVAKRTVHEVAHQWWGHILAPKYMDGSSLFTEGFAKYTEAVVLEKMYGKRALWQLGETANKTYFSGRSFASETEPPLYLTNGASYLSYGKNYTVMLALKTLIGEEQVNKVLKDLVNRFGNRRIPQITSTDFLHAIYRETPDVYHPLINDWFKRVITYDLKVQSASVEKLANGQYKTLIDISARRFETNAEGRLFPVSIDEPIPLGLFTKHPGKTTRSEQILHLESHRINKENTQFIVITREAPLYIAIDPYGTRSDKNQSDNIKTLVH